MGNNRVSCSTTQTPTHAKAVQQTAVVSFRRAPNECKSTNGNRFEIAPNHNYAKTVFKRTKEKKKTNKMPRTRRFEIILYDARVRSIN